MAAPIGEHFGVREKLFSSLCLTNNSVNLARICLQENRYVDIYVLSIISNK